MRRPAAQLTEAVNSDSFLDIVASVVSIMIIMVVMEGMRIKNTPVTTSLRSDPLVTELQHDLAHEQSVRADVLKADGEVKQLREWAAARSIQRDLLLAAVSTMEKKLDEHRQNLEGQKRDEFDLGRTVSQARFRLEQLAKEKEQAEVSDAAPVVLESYSTPIGREVEKNEVHFILWGGKIAHVPKESLEKAFAEDAQRKVYKLSPGSPELTETIGPVDGFKIRYTLELQTNAGRPEIMYLWELKPVSNLMGETADTALSEGSAFRSTLSKLKRGMHTVTIHTYGDSFDAFRKIRKELYRLGFSVAARPLSPEMSIGFSPAGSKSTAQ
jgi:hypothetical protein